MKIAIMAYIVATMVIALIVLSNKFAEKLLKKRRQKEIDRTHFIIDIADEIESRLKGK